MSESKASVPESIFQWAHPHLGALLQSHQSAPWCRHPLLCSLLSLPFISSSLSPSVFHLLLDVNKFDQTDTGKLLFGCCSSALWQILYTLASPSLLLSSHLWFQHAWSATHHHLHRPPSKPSGGAAEGSGMPRRWHNSHSHAAQRHKFEMFKGDCIVSKRPVQI